MPRVLIIDDDPETEPLLRGHFERAGTPFDGEAVFVATDDDALAALGSGGDFDIALVAIDGEATSGMGVFKKITERSFRVPRVALTGGRDLSRIRQAMIEGATDFLIKPVAFDDFMATIERVTEEVERRRRNWRERAEYSALRREVDIAADMQRRILPKRFPERPGLDIFATMRPAKDMGGDFYDVFEIDAERVGFLVADVSGKGIPAAFYMAVARTVIRSVAMAGAPPEDCLDKVNALLYAHEIPGMFVSVFYGVLDTGEWTVACASGGHPPPYVGGAGFARCEVFDGGGGTVLGIQDELPFGESMIDLAPGDFLCVYTDGVTEAFDASRAPFSEARIAACLDAHSGLAAEALIGKLTGALEGFVGDAEPHDDITCLIVRRE